MAKYKPAKLAYKLFEPNCGSDDRLSPLIFLHGLCFTCDVTWDDLPQTFADQTKRKAYTVDSRNHGDSEWSNEFNFDLNAEDLVHFIEEMSFSKVIIIAHSVGGITGIKTALKAPERVEMLFVEDMYAKKLPPFILNTGVKIFSHWKEVEKFILPGIDKKDADRFITEYIISKWDPENIFSFNQMHWKDISYPLGKDSTGRYVFKVNLDVIIEKLKSAETIMAENEGIYEGPSCFLHANDSAYKLDTDKPHILKHFPKAVFVPFDSSKHLIHKEFADLFVETVVKFIKQNEKFQ